jgi:hypothetical protein
MAGKEIFHGVPVLRPFKECIEGKGLKKGDQVDFFMACRGHPRRLSELPGVAIRSPELEQVFIPLVDESKGKTVQPGD